RNSITKLLEGPGGRSVGTPSLLSRDALEGEGVAGVCERGVHALTALFHRALRQPYRGEGREAVRDVGLDVHEVGVDAEHRGGADAGEHGEPCNPRPRECHPISARQVFLLRALRTPPAPRARLTASRTTGPRSRVTA